MPSVAGARDMNGYNDYDRSFTRYNGAPQNGYDGYREDPYGRDEMRPDMDDRYRRSAAIGMSSRNGGPGFDTYGEQNSMYDFRETKFDLDHLATFAAGTRTGFIPPEEGLHKLRAMENSMGIWTMRCTLTVERLNLVIHENGTGDELERFPLANVQDPTAIFKNDRREIYNNLILFTVVEDPLKKKTSQADMHIFQSIKAPAQDIVDEILSAKNGLPRTQGVGSRIPPPPVVPAPEPPNGPYNFQGMRDSVEVQYAPENRTYRVTPNGEPDGQLGPTRAFFSRINTLREKEDLEGKSTEVMERDVALLNHCFDDIEKFVARLQQAAEAFKELERRKKDRGAKNKKRQGGDGMLSARAKPPPDGDFVDIFQKFKLSFNLLAKLRAHIHDPNAPELVHFLFTPLSLIYEASRDPMHGNKNLGDQAVAPVLTGEAKELLLNCLTTKEIELWQTLGKHWTTSVAEWHGHIPTYMPEFYDGWQPASVLADEMTARSAIMSHPPVSEPMRNPIVEVRPNPYNHNPRPIPFPDEDPRLPLIDRFNQAVNNHNDFDRGARDYNSRPMAEPQSRQEGNMAYLDELLKMDDVLIYEVTHDRVGKNSKELTVQKGDILQVLDNNRNWWKLRNYKGTTGFAPYTILTPHKGNDIYRNGDPISARTSSDYGVPKRGASRRGDHGLNVQFAPSPRDDRDRHASNAHNAMDFPSDNTMLPDYRDDDMEVGILNHQPKRGSDYPPTFRNSDVVLRDQFHRQVNQRESGHVPHDQFHRQVSQRDSGHLSSTGRPNNKSVSPQSSGSYDVTPPPSESRSNTPTPPLVGMDDLRWISWEGRGNDRRQVRVRDPHHEELRSKVQHTRVPPQDIVRLDIFSTPSDVVKWLKQKGFSARVQQVFCDYSGQDLFQSHVSEFMDVLSHEEAIRLDGLLRLQKNNSGYATQSAKELSRILQRRKEHVHNTEREEKLMLYSGPRQREPSPTYDSDEPDDSPYQPPVVMRKPKPQPNPLSSSNSNNIQDKSNFRDLLIRQRSRLRQSSTDLDLI